MQVLHVDGMHLLFALYNRRFFELLAAAEFFDNACFFKFAFEFFQGAFDVVAFFYWYNNHCKLLLFLFSVLDCKGNYFFAADKFFQKNLRLFFAGLCSDGYFGDAAFVASAFEIGCEEDFDEFECQFFGDEARRKCQDVGVVVLACKCGQFFVPAECGAYALVFVDGHVDAVAAAADGYAVVACAVFDGVGQWVSEVGIVATFGAVCAEIVNAGIFRFEPCFHFEFQFVACVVGGNADGELV